MISPGLIVSRQMVPARPSVGPLCKVQVWDEVYGKEDWRYCHKPTSLTGAVTVLDFPVCDECAAVIQ